jgi:hypothetical protein
LTAYLNRADVRAALHVDHARPWVACDDLVRDDEEEEEDGDGGGGADGGSFSTISFFCSVIIAFVVVVVVGRCGTTIPWSPPSHRWRVST